MFRETRMVGNLVHVIAAGALAHPDVANGELIPNLILDTANNRSVAELLRIHSAYKGFGDAQTQWGSLIANPKLVSLAVDMTKPVQMSFTIVLDMNRFVSTIDRLLHCRVAYLQAGAPGDTQIDFDAHRMSLEIGATGMKAEKWERMVVSHLRNVMRRKGLSTREATEAAQRQLQNWRSLHKNLRSINPNS